MGLEPVPLDLMGYCQVNEFLPEILIQYLPLPAFGAPAVALPILQPPLCEGFSQITGIGVPLNGAGAFQASACFRWSAFLDGRIEGSRSTGMSETQH